MSRVRDDIRMALHDGIGWQLGLADAYGRDTPEGKEAVKQARRYRNILRRRYGSDQTALDKMLADAELVDAMSLAKHPVHGGGG